MTLTPGDELGRYKILAPIGAGGMGEVYRASDSSLGREVALKILPEEMSSDQIRLARFYREARSAAALNHPNIVTLHSVEESNGVHFLTMELIDGQSLEHMLPAGGFPPHRVIEIAAAIADAISAAHDKGVVHRDLKPANIMITKAGRVKVLDFGLAKELHPTGDEMETRTSFGETQAGVVMGTPPYMSPEQVSGSPMDHRSDIFSLGTIIYEMLTGHRPFEGKSAMELAASILRDAAPPVTRPDAPEELVRLIEQCLAKRPLDRMQSARTLASGLREVRESTAEARPASAMPVSERDDKVDSGFWIAVALFKSTGPSTELAALADGLTEEITAGLTRFSYLHVIGHKSTRIQRARYVLDGNLRLAGATIRLSVQLTERIGGMNLWAETYTRPFSVDSVFDLQDELAVRIITSTADAYGALPRSMSQAVRGKPIDQLTPYEALLRSFTYAERVSANEHATAMQALESALGKEPDFSDGWAMLSLLRTDGYIHGFDASGDGLDRALAAARTAVDKNPANHKAHQSLAWALCFRKEYLAAMAAAERTIALNPFDACARVYMGQLMVSAGAWERGVALVREALPLNPNHPDWYWYPLYCDCYRRGDYRGALDYALQMNMPDFPLAHVALAAAHGQLGDRAGGARAIRDLLALRPDYAALAENELGKIWEASLTAALVDGLRKAGLEIGSASEAPK